MGPPHRLIRSATFDVKEMDENKKAMRVFREGRNMFFHWAQKWMGRGLNEPAEGCDGPVDVWHIVSLLRSGLGFRLRYVDYSAGGEAEQAIPGCRVVATCTASGLRAVLDLPQPQCCCRQRDAQSDGRIWNVTSSTESLCEVGCSSLPHLNQGLQKVVKEVLGQLHYLMTVLNQPLIIEMKPDGTSTGSLQSLSLSPGIETMRRVSSSPVLSKEASPSWPQPVATGQRNLEVSAQSLLDFPSIPSTDISPIQGSSQKAPFRTSSPHSIQTSLEKLSIKSESHLIDKLEEIHEQLGNVIASAKGHSLTLSAGSSKTSITGRTSLTKSTPKHATTTSKARLATPKTVPRDRTVTLKAQSTVKKFLSGSKLGKVLPSDKETPPPKGSHITIKRRLSSQSSIKSDPKIKPDPKIKQEAKSIVENKIKPVTKRPLPK